MSAGVPVGETRAMPPAPQHSNTSLIVVSIALVITLLVLGYFVWMSGVWQSLMPSAADVAPAQSETSDLEADLQGVDVGGDAEVDALEAQL